jgi:hypothetical protein
MSVKIKNADLVGGDNMNIFTLHLKIQQYFLLFRQAHLIKKNLRNLIIVKSGFEVIEEALITQVRAMAKLRKEVG